MKTNQRLGVAGVLALMVLVTLSGPTLLEAQSKPSISLLDLEGSTVQLAALMAGKPTLLVFWATWCGPCRAEIPRINEVFGKFNDAGLAVVAINPGIRDSLANVRRYADAFELSYPVYFDSHQSARSAYSLLGTPTIILLDADGREIQRGETVDLEAIEKLMAQ